jgi:hypothetical protein
MAPAQQPATNPGENGGHLDSRTAVQNLHANVVVNVGYQVRDHLFDGTEKFAAGASEVTEINLDPSTMGMLGMVHGREGAMASKMKTMTVHTYKYDKPGMYKMPDVDAYRKRIESGNWTCSIRVRNKSGSTDICSRVAYDHQTNEMVILAAEPQQLTFIHVSGDLSFDELNEMSGSVSHFRPHSEFTRPAPSTKLERKTTKAAERSAPPAPATPSATAPPTAK